MLEYGAHVRDVLLVLRDRIVVGVVVDNPGFTPMYRDERVDLGMYGRDDPVAVAAELELAGALLTRMIAALSPEQLDRTCQYGYPGPMHADPSMDGGAGGARGRAPPQRRRGEPQARRRLTRSGAARRASVRAR